MINLTNSKLEIRLVIAPTDLRKSFDGLDALARMLDREDSYQKFLWIFSNGRRNRIKLLHFDRSGVWVATKRLEQGTFSWPAVSVKDQEVLHLAPEAVQLLMDGVDLRDGSLRPWWDKEKPSSSTAGAA